MARCMHIIFYEIYGEKRVMILKPVMRTDEHHVMKHSYILNHVRTETNNLKDGGTPSIRTVFFGDSLTRRWEDNPSLWEKYFAPFAPANFGVGADTLNNILWRVQNENLENLAPEKLVFLGGTNSLHDESVGDIIDTIEYILRLFNEKLPATSLLLIGIFPRNDDTDGTVYNSSIVQINAALSAAVRANIFPRTTFADFGSLLLGSDGRLKPELTPDGLHMNAEGYKVLGPELVRLLSAR